MGEKISVDSATMMNKVLELIEARYLFDLPPSKLSMVQHRESLVHALVEEAGGAILAFLSLADMRLAIADVLGAENLDLPRLDVSALGALHFEPIDEERFPAARLVAPALSSAAAAIVLNAANEVLVKAFLQKELAFCSIAEGVESVLESIGEQQAPQTLDDIIALDNLARQKTKTRTS